MSRVRVHFNLHKHVWSITQKGKPVVHAAGFALTNCRMIVSEIGRQHVISDRCRRVHAWVEGEIAQPLDSPPADSVEFTYNPYRAGTFTRRDNGQAITDAACCWFIGKRAFAQPGKNT